MNFDEARPEYYEGLKVFQQHTNQQDQLKRLVGTFFLHLKKELESEPQLESLIKEPLNWKDIGSGDGSFTLKVLDALEEKGFPSPNYEGFEPDEHFLAVSRQTFSGRPSVKITKRTGLEGDLHTLGKSDVISGFNVLYFAKDLTALKGDLEKALEPTGLGLFIQNKAFTDKAGEALIGDNCKECCASIPTEVFFPSVPKQGWRLVTGRASIRDIEKDAVLNGAEKADTIIIKKIIDSMGGISTETEEGQQVAATYQARIESDGYGGKGRYVSDNFLLVYTRSDAPAPLKQAVMAALRNTRQELSAEASSAMNCSKRFSTTLIRPPI